MELTDVEFDYKPGSDYGTGVLTVADAHDCCDFYFDFTAVQDHDCSFSCHSLSQELPDEDYYEYDVIDKILNLDTLVHKIETVFEVSNIKDKIDDFIGEEFAKISKARYLYTR
jgi:hypothetical protein